LDTDAQTPVGFFQYRTVPFPVRSIAVKEQSPSRITAHLPSGEMDAFLQYSQASRRRGKVVLTPVVVSSFVTVGTNRELTSRKRVINSVLSVLQ
jgi:hypothetical protein